MGFSELNSPPIFKRDLSLSQATQVHSKICPQVTPVWSLLCASEHSHAEEVNLFSMTVLNTCGKTHFHLVIQAWLATLIDCIKKIKKKAALTRKKRRDKCSIKAPMLAYLIWELN